jgi:hypothetical protein
LEVIDIPGNAQENCNKHRLDPKIKATQIKKAIKPQYLNRDVLYSFKDMQ